METRHAKAQEFLANLSSKSPELPFEPTLMPELFAATGDSSLASVTQISALVDRSQGLAARILKVANSAYYGMQTAVSSLSHAVRLLGLNEIRSIILQLGVTSAIRQLKLPKGFDFQALWEHQVLTGSVARAFAFALPPLATPDIVGEELYAAGLLHDLGKTLVAANCPEDWQAIAALAKEQNIPDYRAEEAYWGIDHSVVGARLLTFWGLPPRLTELVGWHHAPQHAKDQYKPGAKMLAAANLLSRYELADITSVIPPENPDEEPTRVLVLPEEVKSLLPEGMDMPRLLPKLEGCYDMGKIRSLSEAAGA